MSLRTIDIGPDAGEIVSVTKATLRVRDSAGAEIEFELEKAAELWFERRIRGKMVSVWDKATDQCVRVPAASRPRRVTYIGERDAERLQRFARLYGEPDLRLNFVSLKEMYRLLLDPLRALGWSTFDRT